MSDSVERLYKAIVAAKELDPGVSRTARLLRRGQAKMAKKLAEEAIEVVIDAVQGDAQAVVRESADLIYNLAVVWAAAGVHPQDIWAEMDRRERLLGIAEKLPKSHATERAQPAAKAVVGVGKSAAMAVRRPVIALEARRSPKRR
ncbi:phosphoribosyl-ATP diphosphatase [Bradyrhizobium sp. LHD-71]|uniref:phosphoribosyl-ATP diphosphatase n=1 Tax=Bradyrhizobium sp. LHD-71 TaxID=3072141 RepID=UPI00280F6B28|nr:phosphoribosyl-ATP diphosphatase [Bradyrhizobium sp. LHD-71]MDQ8730664.1 phosphoribosyl-ATP diphosphatase [Bradyrhizobium sp. LHD-71]